MCLRAILSRVVAPEAIRVDTSSVTIPPTRRRRGSRWRRPRSDLARGTAGRRESDRVDAEIRSLTSGTGRLSDWERSWTWTLLRFGNV